MGEGRIDMFSRHFVADVCVSELSLGEGRVTMFSHFFANVLCVSIRVSCGSLTAPRFECLLYFAVADAIAALVSCLHVNVCVAVFLLESSSCVLWST